MDNKHSDITHTTLQVLFLGLFIVAGFWILLPFLSSIIWAATIVVATWPVMLFLEARLKGRRWLATLIMTLALLLIVIGPLLAAITVIIERAADLALWVKSLKDFTVPPPPVALDHIPVLGPKLKAAWAEVSVQSPEELSARVAPYALEAGKWFAARAGSFAILVLQFLMTVVIAAIMYARGEAAASLLGGFVARLAGPQGEEALVLAAKAVRGVALGVVGTALLQTLVGGLGLLITGVPAAALLCAVMFMLCLAQVGPLLVLAPAVAWLYWSEGALWGSVLLGFTLVAVTMDNVLRPMLIKRGVDMPLVMIFAGVLGGLMAFGIIGLFIGPVVLAVGYTLLKAWIAGNNRT